MGSGVDAAMAVHAAQYIDYQHLPFFFTESPDEARAATCSAMQPVQLDSDYNFIDKVHSVESWSQFATAAADACRRSMARTTTTWPIRCRGRRQRYSGCFFTWRSTSPDLVGDWYFCDDDPSPSTKAGLTPAPAPTPRSCLPLRLALAAAALAAALALAAAAAGALAATALDTALTHLAAALAAADRAAAAARVAQPSPPPPPAAAQGALFALAPPRGNRRRLAAHESPAPAAASPPRPRRRACRRP